MRALIAEDDEQSRMILSRFIAGSVEYELAVDGGEALEKYHAAITNGEPFQIIFLDIMMPKHNGLEVLRIIREDEQSRNLSGFDAVKIVMTTALDDEERILDAHLSGCVSYLIKPLSKKLVLEEIEKCKQDLGIHL
jgi:two-component system chemotaxis response regulator CheY